MKLLNADVAPGTAYDKDGNFINECVVAQLRIAFDDVDEYRVWLKNAGLHDAELDQVVPDGR